MKKSVVILDNGGNHIKAGLSKDGANQGRLIQNAVVRSKGDKRQYIGHEFSQCKDHVSLNWRLPLERGYLTDWDVQKAIWDGILSEDVLRVDPKESCLLITEPPFNFISIQERYDQFAFEEYEFDSYYRSTPAALTPSGSLFQDPSSPTHQPPECCLIIDSGFSFTHIIPLLNSQPVWSAVRRIDIGGKLLTNQLAQLVSFRQWNMLDQNWIINQVKERCCYITSTKQQFGLDLELCRATPKRNPIVQEYLLPDYAQNRPGRLRDPSTDILSDTDQVIVMENERFTVPELLFRPNDIGMEQAGLGEAVADAIGSLPEEVQGMFWTNIGLIGGNTRIDGFDQRLMYELRPLAPTEYEIVLYKDEDPVMSAYNSAYKLSRTSAFSAMTLTRAEYNEGGSNAAWRKFGDWRRDRPVWSLGEDDMEMAAGYGDGGTPMATEGEVSATPTPSVVEEPEDVVGGKRGRGRQTSGTGRGMGRGKGRGRGRERGQRGATPGTSGRGRRGGRMKDG